MAPRAEKREDPDTGVKYTEKEFTEYYGAKKGAKQWANADPKPAKGAGKGAGKACTVCGNTNHLKADCKFKDKECSNCGKTGHLAKVCRQEGGGGGASKAAPKAGKACTVCGKDNHSKADCKFKDEECRNCGKTGHLAKMCRAEGGGAEGGAAAKKAPAAGKACSVCGNSNHLKADCKFKDKECSNCGKTGHLAKVCRAEGGGAEGGGSAKKASPKKERPERAPRTLATEGEIPIKRVARIYNAKVKDEEGALKLDALVNDVQTKLRENRKEKSKGFIKIARTLCKTEWAYEVSIVWRSFEDFTAYKASEFRKEVSGEFETKIKDIITGDFSTGVRVYDEL